MNIDIVVFDGLDELDALGPLEVLRRAAQQVQQLTVRLVQLNGRASVCGAVGLRFEVDGSFVPGEQEILVVPGGGWATKASRGAWAEVQHGELFEPLVGARKTARIVAGVCTGTMILAHAGLVGSRRVSTHHNAFADLRELGATVVPDRVVDDGDLVTSGGVTSGIDLALWLVEREFDVALAERISRNMEYDRFRPSRAS